MPLRFRTVHQFLIWSLPILAVACSANCQERAGPVAIREGGSPEQPRLEIRFQPSQGLRAKAGEVSCEVPKGRDQVYDPDTGVFHVHFKAGNFTASGFEVTKVPERLPKPVVFRLTGVPLAYGCVGVPLALTVGENRYPLIDVGHDSFHPYERFDRTLFRIERKDDVVTVAFTEKGQTILKPGAQVSFKIDTGW
jgi:hypothetical protein